MKPDVSARDLLTLPELQALVRTKLDGGATQLFTIQNPIVATGNEDWVQQAMAYSDRHDGRPAALVDEEIKAMYRTVAVLSQPDMPDLGGDVRPARR